MQAVTAPVEFRDDLTKTKIHKKEILPEAVSLFSLKRTILKSAEAISVMFLTENLTIQRSASIAFDQSNVLGLSPNPYYKQKEQE